MSSSSRALFLFDVLIKSRAGAIFGILTLVSYPIKAMTDAHQQGLELAINKDFSMPHPGSPENVPGYAGIDLPQSQIRAHDLNERASSEAHKNEAAQIIGENVAKGDRYVIDPHTDPLIQAGNKIIADPLKILDEQIIETEERLEDKGEIITCEESGDETLEDCDEIRIVDVKEPNRLDKHRVDILVSHFGGTVSCNVLTGQGSSYLTSHNPLPSHLKDRVDHIEIAALPYPGVLISGYTFDQQGNFSMTRVGGKLGVVTLNPFWASFDIFYKALPTEDDVSETIENKCQYYEDRVEKGLCSYEDIQVIEGPQTRTINGYPVSRDWWRRKKIYRCHYPSKNDCGPLRAKGCYQTQFFCKEMVRNVCVVWKQTYQCPSGKKTGKTFQSSNKKNPFCLSGDCADKSYTINGDFAEVMSQMSVLKEAGDDLRNFGTIFKGQDRRCTRHCLDFKDCCGNGNGWGVSLNLVSCDKNEKELAEIRSKGRCIQVGTYCAEKILGQCIRKKTTFCCYDCKLAKIIQEQGKGQLGLGFGSPEHPDCQGLTAEQLSRIDFSKINFTEIFSEIVARTKTPNPEAITKGIQKSMENKASLLNMKEKGPTQTPQLSKDTKSLSQDIQGRSYGQF